MDGLVSVLSEVVVIFLAEASGNLYHGLRLFTMSCSCPCQHLTCSACCCYPSCKWYSALWWFGVLTAVLCCRAVLRRCTCVFVFTHWLLCFAISCWCEVCLKAVVPVSVALSNHGQSWMWALVGKECGWRGDRIPWPASPSCVHTFKSQHRGNGVDCTMYW